MRLEKWELWRQDDGGNTYLVAEFEEQVDAEKSLHEYESRGHKQVYWLKHISENFRI